MSDKPRYELVVDGKHRVMRQPATVDGQRFILQAKVVLQNISPKHEYKAFFITPTRREEVN